MQIRLRIYCKHISRLSFIKDSRESRKKDKNKEKIRKIKSVQNIDIQTLYIKQILSKNGIVRLCEKFHNVLATNMPGTRFAGTGGIVHIWYSFFNH